MPNIVETDDRTYLSLISGREDISPYLKAMADWKGNKPMNTFVRGIIPGREDNHTYYMQQEDYGEDGLIWNFPGGMVEPGEAPGKALERELYEETGIKVTTYRLLGEYTGTFKGDPWKGMVYLVTGYEGDPKWKETKTVDTRWFKESELTLGGINSWIDKELEAARFPRPGRSIEEIGTSEDKVFGEVTGMRHTPSAKYDGMPCSYVSVGCSSEDEREPV